MRVWGVSLVGGEAEELTSEAEDFSSPLIEAIPARDHCWRQYAHCSLCNGSSPPLAIAAPPPRYCTLSHLSLPRLMTLLWQSAYFHSHPALLMNHSVAHEVRFIQRAGEQRDWISTLSTLPPSSSSSPFLSSSSNDARAAAESIPTLTAHTQNSPVAKEHLWRSSRLHCCRQWVVLSNLTTHTHHLLSLIAKQ